jgi:hypothetical protein
MPAWELQDEGRRSCGSFLTPCAMIRNMELDSAAQSLIAITWISVIITAITSAAISATLAKHKGYNQSSGCVFGFLFGIFALLYYIGVPDLVQRIKNIDANDLLEEIRDELGRIRELINHQTAIMHHEYESKRKSNESESSDK